MKDTLTFNDMKNILVQIGQLMDENKDFLCQLDGAIGDGDIGLTMSKGFRAVVDNFPEIKEESIDVLLMKSAMVMGEKVASTMGTLMATALIRGGKAVKGKTELTLADLAEMTKAMTDGLMERGKAKPGDKTILDSLIPAYEALAAASSDGKPLREAIHGAFAAAEEGALATKNMQSRHGRGARYLEKSIGHQDPGATVGALFFKGFHVYIDSVA
jgi:dihydroxyacetone kinase-like protein